MKALASSDCAISRCTAREAMQVKTTQRENFILPAYYHWNSQCANNQPITGPVTRCNDVTIIYTSNTTKQEKSRSRITFQQVG